MSAGTHLLECISVPMERAGRSLAKLRISTGISADELALAAWSAAVGKRIAQHARAVALVRGNLVVEVDDAIWRKQLFSLRSQILAKIRGVLGDVTVTDVEFRVSRERRPPQMAAHVRESAPMSDDADRIADPVLRILYKQARKKATG